MARRQPWGHRRRGPSEKPAPPGQPAGGVAGMPRQAPRARPCRPPAPEEVAARSGRFSRGCGGSRAGLGDRHGGIAAPEILRRTCVWPRRRRLAQGSAPGTRMPFPRKRALPVPGGRFFGVVASGRDGRSSGKTGAVGITRAPLEGPEVRGRGTARMQGDAARAPLCGRPRTDRGRWGLPGDEGPASGRWRLRRRPECSPFPPPPAPPGNGGPRRSARGRREAPGARRLPSRSEG